jgi:hypothetical protein
VTTEAQKRHLLCERLPFRRPYHTPVFEPFLGPPARLFATVRVKPPQIPVYSCYTAAPFPSDAEAIRRLGVPRALHGVDREPLRGGGAVVRGKRPRGNLSAFVEDILRGGGPAIPAAGQVAGELEKEMAASRTAAESENAAARAAGEADWTRATGQPGQAAVPAAETAAGQAAKRTWPQFLKETIIPGQTFADPKKISFPDLGPLWRRAPQWMQGKGALPGLGRWLATRGGIATAGYPLVHYGLGDQAPWMQDPRARHVRDWILGGLAAGGPILSMSPVTAPFAPWVTTSQWLTGPTLAGEKLQKGVGGLEPGLLNRAIAGTASVFPGISADAATGAPGLVRGGPRHLYEYGKGWFDPNHPIWWCPSTIAGFRGLF